MMDYRHIAIGLLLALVIFVVAGTFSKTKDETDEDLAEIDQIQLNLRYLKRAGFSQEDGAYLMVDKKGGDDLFVTISVYEKKPIDEIVLIYGPWVGAENFDMFRKELRIKAEEAGLDFEVQDVDRMHIGVDRTPRCYILPSGAWPKVIVEDWDRYFSRDDLIIYFGIDEDALLQEDSRISRGGLKKGFLEDIEEEEIRIDGVRVFRKRHTLDEYYPSKDFVSDLVFQIAQNGSEKKVVEEEYEFIDERFSVLLKGLEQDKDYWARIMVYDENSNILIWDRDLERMDGKVIGPVLNGDKDGFQIILQPDVDSLQEVEFFSVLLDRDLDEIEKKSLRRETIYDGGEEIILLSTEFEKNDYRAGGNIILIKDQFDREYVRTVVDVPDYEIRLIRDYANQRKYALMDGGKKTDLKIIHAKKEGEDRWKRIELVDSKFTIESDWDVGENSVLFEIDGIRIEDEWVQRASRWQGTMVWGILILSITMLLIYLFRPKTQRIYTIEIEDRSLEQMQKKRIVGKDFLKIVDLINKKKQCCGAEDIVSYFVESEQFSDYFPSVSSVQRILRRYEKKGVFVGFDGYYADAKKMSGEQIKHIRISRELVDAQIKYANLLTKMDAYEFVDPQKKRWQIYEKKRFFEQLKKGRGLPDYLVFWDKEDLDRFYRSVLKSKIREADGLRLKIKTGRLRLVDVLTMKKEY